MQVFEPSTQLVPQKFFVVVVLENVCLLSVIQLIREKEHYATNVEDKVAEAVEKLQEQIDLQVIIILLLFAYSCSSCQYKEKGKIEKLVGICM